jgi:FkbM family methyltransferase
MASYFRHGVALNDGDVVFDVGANIGLFGLWVQRMGRAGVSVYSFEPIPSIFKALEANARRFGDGRWQVFRCGLGSRSGEASFGYHPHATVWSSPYPDDSPRERKLIRGAVLRNLPAYHRSIRWLRWLPGFLRGPLVDLCLGRAFRYKKVVCQVRTLSEMLRETAAPRIDLLKIDVQRGEMDVLAGIAEEDWARVRQVVMEIHDLSDQRVAQATALLRRHGFGSVVVEQEPMFRGTDIYNLFAVRAAGTARSEHAA